MPADQFELLTCGTDGSEKSVGVLFSVRAGKKIPNVGVLRRSVDEEIKDEYAPM